MEGTQFDRSSSLPNHLYFNQELNQALREAKKHHKRLALLFIDIDNFTKLKQNHGLGNAHLVLQELERRFKSLLSTNDRLVQLENDEFALVLTALEEPKLAASLAHKLLEISLVPLKIASTEIQLSISIGIAIFPDDGQSLEELQKHADAALHQAKAAGRGGYEFCSPQTVPQAQDYPDFQQALQNNEFILYYQPKLDLKENRIHSVEALIRWNHSKYGLISPSRFIPAAEENGFIIPLGEWILREACRVNKQWQLDGHKPIPISVNLSPKQFYHPQITTMIEKALEIAQLDPCYLDLEITEMTVMDELGKINQFLSHFREKGISLSVDDFGTGHTSIRYLKAFPFNFLKIDQSFIKSLPENEKNAEITCDMISLAHELEIKVVAEGVETMEQLQFLRQYACDFVQGYFISRPLAASKLAALLA